MAGQPSRDRLDQAAPGTIAAPPAPDATLYTGPDEFFTGNFNFLDLKDAAIGPGRVAALGAAARSRRARSDGRADGGRATRLPPAAFKLLGKRPAPVSSLTWIVNLLTPDAGHARRLVAAVARAPIMRRTAVRASR